MTTEWPRTQAAHEWTGRQREVLDLLAKGRSNSEIAAALGISLDGAKWHVREIIGQLGVESRYEAADYWRVRNGLRARLWRAGAAVLSAQALRWVGAGAAVVVAGIAIAAVALALRGGDGDGEPAAPTETETATATPTPPASTTTPGATPTASPTQQTIAGIPVREWRVTAPQELPQDVVLYIEKGCIQCDGPTEALERVTNIGNPGDVTLSSRTLFASKDTAAPEDYISSYVFGIAGSDRIYLTVCSRGYCGGVGQMTPDAQTTLYASTDRGITWQEIWTRDGAWTVMSATGEGVVVALTRYEGGQFFIEYFYAISEERFTIDGPAPGAEPLRSRGDLTHLWRLADRRTIVHTNGDVIFEPPADLATNDVGIWLGGAINLINPNGLHLVWQAPDGKRYSALALGNAVQQVFAEPEGRSAPYLGHWLTPTTALGTMWVLDSELGPGVSSIGGGLNMPVLADFEAGTITPLLIYGPITADNYRGRNYVISYEQGTFFRVQADGDCLNLREQPESASPSVGCFADDVLLVGADKETITDAGGTTWGAMTAPGQLQGWAAMDFLVRE